jgi:hypothetical protein
MVAMQMARYDVAQRIWIHPRRKQCIARAHRVHNLILLRDSCGEHPRLKEQVRRARLHMEEVQRLQKA